MAQDHFATFAHARTAWVVSDGTKGMEVQSLGLAERMGLETTVLRFPPPLLLRHFPRSAFWPLIPLPAPCRKAWRDGGWPDVILTTGRRMAGLSMLLRRKSGGASRTIHIQDPKLPPTLFDLMIIPSHDRLRGDNVLVTTGSLNTLTEAKISAAAAVLPQEVLDLPRPVIAVMIGGTNRRYAVNEPHLLRLGQVASGLGHATGGSLVFIPSRRSHDMAAACISATIGQDLIEVPAHWIWDGASANPYPGILGHADAVVVTSDSVNMTSEACRNGLPVYRYHFKDETGRIALFHAIMDEGGFTRPLEPFNVMEFPAPRGPGLDETGRIARLLRGRDG